MQEQVVHNGEQVAYQSSRTEGSFPDSVGILNVGVRQDSFDSRRQHISSGIYQQTGSHKIRDFVCPSVENTGLV